MAIATLKELIECGVHFGSHTSRWNPKMKPFIHSRQNKIHIIDLKETLRGLIRSVRFIEKATAKGQKILFVGTKRQASEIIRAEAARSNSYFVATRWLGGTLTNMSTMRNRITRLQELEKLEESGEIAEFSKKMVSSLTRERKKIFRNFEGIRDMKDVPGAIVIVDPKQEHIAIAEATKLGIPTIAICDTDCDPEPVDFLIPGNDDSLRSLSYLLAKLSDAVISGSKKASTNAAMAQRASQTAKAGVRAEQEEIKDLPQDFTQVGGFSYGGED